MNDNLNEVQFYEAAYGDLSRFSKDYPNRPDDPYTTPPAERVLQELRSGSTPCAGDNCDKLVGGVMRTHSKLTDPNTLLSQKFCVQCAVKKTLYEGWIEDDTPPEVEMGMYINDYLQGRKERGR